MCLAGHTRTTIHHRPPLTHSHLSPLQLGQVPGWGRDLTYCHWSWPWSAPALPHYCNTNAPAAHRLLTTALQTGWRVGKEKVLEYVFILLMNLTVHRTGCVEANFSDNCSKLHMECVAGILVHLVQQHSYKTAGTSSTLPTQKLQNNQGTLSQRHLLCMGKAKLQIFKIPWENHALPFRFCVHKAL